MPDKRANTNKSRDKRWIRFRHKAVSTCLRPVFAAYIRLTTGYTYKPFTALKKEPYLILYNHVSPWDQFFVGVTCKSTIYYVAMDNIFAIRFVGRIIKFLIAPIPFKKSSSDSRAVKQCYRIVKEGGSIALSPEGNRSYDGYLAYIKPSITKLIRLLRVPVAFFVIEGGYGLNPRWAKKGRKGSVSGSVVKILQPDEIRQMSDDELYEAIRHYLYAPPGKENAHYRSNEKAEYLERLIYYCPECGMGNFRSEGNVLTCRKCGLKVEHTEALTFVRDGGDFPYKTVHEWYDAQNRYVETMEPENFVGAAMFAEKASIYNVIDGKKKDMMIKDGHLQLYGDRLAIEGAGQKYTFKFCDIDAAAIVAKKKFSIYVGDMTYQFTGGERFNSIKFVNMIYHYKNVKERMNYTYDGREFLGL